MQQDAWRTYLELALGLTEKPRKRAKQVIDAVSAQRGASVDQVKAMTEELAATSSANRDALVRTVRGELDRALARVGVARAEEVEELRRRVDELERRLAEREVPTAVAKAAPKTAAKKAAAGKSAAKKAPGKKATTTGKTAAKKAPAKKTTARRPAAGG